MKEAKKKTFTPLFLEALNPPKEGRLEIGDKLCPGLLLRVSKSGVKSFSVIYRVPGEGGISPNGRPLAGKQHRVTLGRWPILDVPTAREMARNILIEALSGKDPRYHRQQMLASLAENTVSQVFSRYIERQAKPSLRNWKNVESALTRMVVPEWGNMQMADITRRDAHALLDKIAQEKGPHMASAIRRLTGRAFSWAVDRDIIPVNPFLRMDRPDDEKYTPRERCLSDDELAVIWEATKQLGYPSGPAIQLLILTGLRRANVTQAQWSWIDTTNRILTVPKSEFKSNRIHEAPLSKIAWEILQSLPRYNDAQCLFRSTRSAKPMNSWSSIKADLDKAIKALRPETPLQPWTIHDIRHTVKTGLSRLRVNADIKDRVMGHAKRGMDAVYDHHDYREEKREALELWAIHLTDKMMNFNLR